MVVDQNPRGFTRMLDVLVEESSTFDKNHIVFNSQVKKIDYNDQIVSISTKDGRLFRAKQVISMIPLGDLQHWHDEMFNLPLSNDMQTALVMSSVINVTKIYIQFPSLQWDDNMTQ